MKLDICIYQKGFLDKKRFVNKTEGLTKLSSQKCFNDSCFIPFLLCKLNLIKQSVLMFTELEFVKICWFLNGF